MNKIIVIGTGGFAKEIIWLANACGKNVVGILDEIDNEVGTFAGLPVLGTENDWQKFSDCEFVIAIGSPAIRHKIASFMKKDGDPKFSTLIHPSVVMSDSVKVGEGTMICAGNVITVDIEIGEHCILNINSTVGHDSVINDFVTIAPMVTISGEVCIGRRSEIGTSSCIRQQLNIGSNSMLGMGSTLTKPIPDNSMFFGSPAKFFKTLK
jgi:sugar O-acyltransferase (sialic acid O-acetyltransferase NeuD family)